MKFNLKFKLYHFDDSINLRILIDLIHAILGTVFFLPQLLSYFLFEVLYQYLITVLNLM